MKRFGKLSKYVFEKLNVGVKRFNAYDEDCLKSIKQVREKTTLLLSNADAVFLMKTLEETLNKVNGIVIEAGSALGGSALLIQEIIDDNKNRKDKKDRKFFFIDPFTNGRDKIVEKLIDTSKSIMLIGLFPQDLEHHIENEEIAFAHIDTDFIGDGMLDFLYKRMAKGGIVFIHDYRNFFYNKEVYIPTNKFAENMDESLLSYPMSSYAFFIKK